MATKPVSKVRKVTVGAGNFVSQLFFFWVFYFIWILRRTKNMKDLLLSLRKSEKAKVNDEFLGVKWMHEKDQAKKENRLPLIRRAIFKAYGSLFLLNGVWKLVWGITLWFGAYWLLKQTITYVRAKSTDRVAGHMYAFGFLLSSVFSTIAIHQLISRSGCLGLRVKSALMVQIFKKSLVLSRVAGGNILNLVSNDCQKIADACTNLQYLWSAVCEVITILVLAFVELNYSAAPALGIILLLIMLMIQFWIISKLNLKLFKEYSKPSFASDLKKKSISPIWL